MAAKQESLFPKLNMARYGENRPHRPLFLPNYLKQESRSNLLKGKTWDQAYEIVCKWADLESSGKLEEKKQAIHLARVLLAVSKEWEEVDITAYRLEERKADGTYHITVTCFQKGKEV